jgi:hypothetical protein
LFEAQHVTQTLPFRSIVASPPLDRIEDGARPGTRISAQVSFQLGGQRSAVLEVALSNLGQTELWHRSQV